MLKLMSVFDQCLALSNKLIVKYLHKRLLKLHGHDKKALESEFKEWLSCTNQDEIEIWSIPDLTNKTLRSFFLRAISQDN